MVAAETIDTAESPAEAALDNVFAALADPVRRAVLTRLDGEDLLVSELAAPFDISLQAVSRHIQVLVRAGLVKQERTGRISRCRLDAGPIFEAALWLNRYSKYWQSQFDTLAVWLDHISSAEQEGPDARSRGQRKIGGVPPRDRGAARQNASAAKEGRARRRRRLPVRDD
jgi:DNA-binding transcriptional ArsR family regulator